MRLVQSVSTSGWWLAAGVVFLAVFGALTPRAAQAQADCSATYEVGKRYCVDPIVTEWKWTATNGYWALGPYSSESAALAAGMSKATSINTAPPSTVCSYTYERTDHDVYPISYDAGFDVVHGHVGTVPGHMPIRLHAAIALGAVVQTSVSVGKAPFTF